MSVIARTHAIERTSPKGPGTTFIGTCWQCGLTGLRAEDALKPCENITGFTQAESLAMAVKGPDVMRQEVLGKIAEEVSALKGD